jgi:hypothetical protein
MNDLRTAYLDEARSSLRGHKRLAEGAIVQVSDDQLFHQLDPEANSIAIVMKHISGNQRSRFTDFLTTDGEKPNRHRDTEFEMPARPSREELMRMWEEGWQRVFGALDSLRPEDVERTVTIRGEPHTVLQAINRQVAHYAYHVGQIVLLAKHLRGAEWKTLSIARGQSTQYEKQSIGKLGMSEK